MSSEYRNLPDGYTQVEYIRHKNLGYIDTGVPLTSTIRVEADFQIETIYYGFQGSIIGLWTTNNKIRMGFNIYNEFVTSYNGDTVTTYSQTLNIYERTTATAHPYSGVSGSDTTTIYIFGQHEISGNTHVFANTYTAKLYSLQIIEGNDTKVRDFVPAIRESDNQVGLYEMVNNVFYTEQIDLPDEYQRLEYLESTGTQYINTGVNTSGTLGFFANFLTHNTIATSEMGGYGNIFGACDATSPIYTNAYFLETWTSDPDTFRGTFSRSNSSSIANYNPGIETDTDLTVGHSSIAKVFVRPDGSYIEIDASTDDISGSQPIYIFARNEAGTAGSFTSTRIYLFMLFNNYQTTHIYVPCLKTALNTPGLYDIVDGTFLVNSGTGTFDFGNPIDTNSDPGPQVRNVQQLTVEFGLIKEYPQTTVIYEGDDDSGVTVIIDSFGPATNIRVDRQTGGEYLQIDSAKFRAIVGSDIQEYDHIEINTRRGHKSATISRNGTKYNILHAVVSSQTWIHLDHGANVFTFAAASGINNVRVHISYHERFNGV